MQGWQGMFVAGGEGVLGGMSLKSTTPSVCCEIEKKRKAKHRRIQLLSFSSLLYNYRTK